MVQNLSYHPPLGEGDHVVIIFDLPLDQKKKVGGWTAEHNVLKTNFEAVKEGLNSLNWDDILKSDFQHDYPSKLTGKTFAFASPALQKAKHMHVKMRYTP